VDAAEQFGAGFPQSGLQEEWRSATFQLDAGTHSSFKWRYAKDMHGRAGQDMVKLTNIRIRNAVVEPVKMTQILTVTNVQAQLSGKMALVEAAAGTYFNRPAADVKATVSVGNAPADPSSLRRLDESAAGNQFSFYKLRLEVSCDSSASCGTVSSTMFRAQQEPDVLAKPVGNALDEPLMKCTSAEVQPQVVGTVAPGLQPITDVTEVGADGLSAERSSGSLSRQTWQLLAIAAVFILAAFAGIRWCAASNSAAVWIRGPRGYDDSAIGLTDRSSMTRSCGGKLAGAYSDSD